MTSAWRGAAGRHGSSSSGRTAVRAPPSARARSTPAQASASSASIVAPGPPAAMPAETVTAPAPGTRASARAAIRRSQQDSAPARPVPGMRTAISSAPVRPSRSSARTSRRRRAATARSAASPAVVPWRAFSARKPSMSTTATRGRAAVARGAAQGGLGVGAEGVEAQQPGARVEAVAVAQLGLQVGDARAGRMRGRGAAPSCPPGASTASPSAGWRLRIERLDGCP